MAAQSQDASLVYTTADCTTADCATACSAILSVSQPLTQPRALASSVPPASSRTRSSPRLIGCRLILILLLDINHEFTFVIIKVVVNTFTVANILAILVGGQFPGFRAVPPVLPRVLGVTSKPTMTQFLNLNNLLSCLP
ncbi:Uncharacterized protein Fot_38542 [Forsythia ovata]|uniref:Uncharacterized protein n=1 Tax=Forsythia ovata TaxID=205694 RepID=A0ABD1S245_9LAMI